MTQKATMPDSQQLYGENPIAQRKTDLYKQEYVHSFVQKWDALIDWEARASSEGDFFIRILKERGVKTDIGCCDGNRVSFYSALACRV